MLHETHKEAAEQRQLIKMVAPTSTWNEVEIVQSTLLVTLAVLITAIGKMKFDRVDSAHRYVFISHIIKPMQDLNYISQVWSKSDQKYDIQNGIKLSQTGAR